MAKGMKWGKHLMAARAKAGLKHADVAKAFQIHESRISEWENDVHKPGGKNLRRLAELYQVSIDELMSGPAPAGHAVPVPRAQDALAVRVLDHAARIAELAAQLTEAAQAQLAPRPISPQEEVAGRATTGETLPTRRDTAQSR